MFFSQPSDIRAVNRLRVLNLIRDNESVSRADISKLLGLNKPSCSEIVQGLLDEGLLVETEKTPTGNGRRPTPLALNKNGKFVVGVDMGSRACSMVISDLKGNLLRYERFPTPPSPKPEELCYQILKSLLRITKGTTLSGLAVCIDGEISDDGKTVLSQKEWNWSNVPLALAFEKNLQVKSIIVGSNTAMVTAERWFQEKVPESFLFLNWDEHISASVVQGSRISMGSMGHLKVSERGLCRCGKIGCLETIAAGWALSEQFGGKNLKQLCQEKPEGFPKALATACATLAQTLAAMITMTGIKHIIAGGSIPANNECFDMLLADFTQIAPKDAVLERSGLGDKEHMLAPVAMALDHFVFQQSFLDAMR
jgi:predicted NBD/HSP70 family sugar kinase